MSLDPNKIAKPARAQASKSFGSQASDRQLDRPGRRRPAWPPVPDFDPAPLPPPTAAATLPPRWLVLAFDVLGEPLPEKRPRWARRTGHMHRDRSADPWKRALRAAAVGAIATANDWAGPIASPAPLSLDIELRFERPPEHTAPDGAVHPGAPTWHAVKPDRDNCEKAILDGLGKFDGLAPLLWTDDQQVAVGILTKRFTRAGEQQGARLTLYRLEPPMAARARITLTNGEAWWIDRRRAGLSVDAMAELLGMSPGIYRLWELDARESPRRELDEITAGEWCAVLRARHGLTTRELGTLSGLVPGWIVDAEFGRVEAGALVAWWQRYLRNLSEHYANPPLPPGAKVGVLRVPPPHKLDARPRRKATPPTD